MPSKSEAAGVTRFKMGQNAVDHGVKIETVAGLRQIVQGRWLVQRLHNEHLIERDQFTPILRGLEEPASK